MLNIYEYDRLGGAENELILLASDEPLSNPYYTLVGTAEAEPAARQLMRDRIYAQVHVDHIPGVTKPAYSIHDLQSCHLPAGVAFGIRASGNQEEF